MGTHASAVSGMEECDLANGYRDATKTVARGAVQPFRSKFLWYQECLATTLNVLAWYGVQRVQKCTHVRVNEMTDDLKYDVIRQTIDAKTTLFPPTISF